MTTDSKHNDPVAKNILGGIFNAHKSCEKWLTDITYIATQDGFLFWCIIVDLFSRRIIGWSAADHILCIGRPDFDRNFVHIFVVANEILVQNPCAGPSGTHKRIAVRLEYADRIFVTSIRRLVAPVKSIIKFARSACFQGHLKFAHVGIVLNSRRVATERDFVFNFCEPDSVVIFDIETILKTQPKLAEDNCGAGFAADSFELDSIIETNLESASNFCMGYCSGATDRSSRASSDSRRNVRKFGFWAGGFVGLWVKKDVAITTMPI